MKIAIASDHGGFTKKAKIVTYLQKKGYEIIDCGTDSLMRVDFPDFAFKVGTMVVDNTVDLGILICTSGIGMSIAANKIDGIRCAKIDNTFDAKMAKAHNDANVIAFGSHTHTLYQIKDMIDIFLKTGVNKEEHYKLRNAKITNYEKGNHHA